MIPTGKLLVSFRGSDFRIWSSLGCFGQNANILSRQVASEKIEQKIRIFLVLLVTLMGF